MASKKRPKVPPRPSAVQAAALLTWALEGLLDGDLERDAYDAVATWHSAQLKRLDQEAARDRHEERLALAVRSQDHREHELMRYDALLREARRVIEARSAVESGERSGRSAVLLTAGRKALAVDADGDVIPGGPQSPARTH